MCLMINAFALTGRIQHLLTITQGVALGYEHCVIALSGRMQDSSSQQ